MIKIKSFLVAFIFLLLLWFVFSKTQASFLRLKVIDFLRLPIKIAYEAPQNLKYLNPIYYLRLKESRKDAEIAALKRIILELKDTSYENNRLRTLLNFREKFAPSAIAAEVIAKDPSNQAGLIIIDKGSNDGIKRDMCVTSYSGLAGRIYEVSSNISKVLLITDSDSRLGVFIERSREQGLLVGLNENLCRIVYLEKDADVVKGDLVYTSGLTGIFPKGIIVGEVINVGKALNNLYKYADIKPYSKPSKLEEVLCIK